jgi:hypothetical protein
LPLPATQSCLKYLKLDYFSKSRFVSTLRRRNSCAQTDLKVPMIVRSGVHLMIVACLASCTAAAPRFAPAEQVEARPLDTLPPGGDDLELVRRDLIATASDRFGSKWVTEALASPTFVIAKRFAGMPPPPPPGAGPDWVAPTPTALLIKRQDGWIVATATGWRPARAEAAAELDQVLADASFWSEPAYVPPCPDYGASLLLLKMPGRSATIRKSTCMSVAEKAVFAALRA